MSRSRTALGAALTSALCVIAAVATFVVPLPAGAQTESGNAPFEVPATDSGAADPGASATLAPTPLPTPTDTGSVEAAVHAAIELPDITDQLARAQRSVAVNKVAADEAKAAVQETEAAIAQNEIRLDSARNIVKQQALAVYTRGTQRVAAGLAVEHTQDLAAGRHYAVVATSVDTRLVDELTRLGAALADERDQRAALRDRLLNQQAALEAQASKLETVRAKDQAALDKVGGVTVMGDSILSAAQLATWFRSTGAVPQLAPGTSIDDVTAMYIQEGAAEHVRGDLAFAQSIIETASFSVAAGNNYSGIGVCDSCTGGYAFPAPRDGVRAQIQLLRNYADPTSRAKNLAHPPSPGLYGPDPDRAARLYDGFFKKGVAPLWNLMGNGNWATSTTYANSVMTLYARMLAFAGTTAASSSPTATTSPTARAASPSSGDAG